MLKNNELLDLIKPVLPLACEAGGLILEIYNEGFDVEYKNDGSPLTTADRLSHNLIVDRLQVLTPGIPVISEESKTIDYQQRKDWSQFWLVDPLDGTKEFVKRNGEFSVNIALVEHSKPVLGVVYAPVTETFYYATDGSNAYRQIGSDQATQIKVKEYRGGSATVVASRSHGRGPGGEFLARLKHKEGDYQIIHMGSALKICVVAEGGADIYPRLGPTGEWDTAAAHCVINAAGGQLVDVAGQSLVYNKPVLLNPWFLAVGSGQYDWPNLVAGIEQD